MSELLDAALCYAAFAGLQIHYGDDSYEPTLPPRWPWPLDEWQPASEPIGNLETVAELIRAEIDRLHAASA